MSDDGQIGCGDNSCIFRVLRTGAGMATNGGCRCFKNLVGGAEDGSWSNRDDVKKVERDTLRLRALVTTLTRERDEARLQALMNLVNDAQRDREAALVRELDEARAEAARLREELEYVASGVADIARIRAALVSTSATDWLRERLEAQREACARMAEWAAERVRTTPLVGGGR